MDIYLILKIAGIGVLSSVASIILEGSGDKVFSAKLITIAGVLVSASIIIGKLSEVIQTTIEVFHLM